MEENKYGDLGEYAKESAKKEYVYSKMPENIRQVGEPGDGIRIYIEDYVMTYMRKVFNEKQENAIVILLGKKGRDAAAGCEFIYGVISVECDLTEGTKELTADKWNNIYRDMHEYFPGAQMLGWGCGVSMWNSRIDAVVMQIQQKYFSEENKILFVADIAEREEKLFVWKEGELAAKSGFVIYYEKNPQMQDYMLQDQDNGSFEESYEDDVTVNMRRVINRNEEKTRDKNKYTSYSIAIAAVAVIILGAGFIVKNMSRIESLQQSVDVMKDYIDEQKIVLATLEPTKSTGTATASGISENDSKKDKDKKSGKSKNLDKNESMDKKRGIENESTNVSKKENDTILKDRELAKQVDKINESYIVREGDTLSQIVWRQYHTFDYIKRVMKVNHIKNSDEIYEGDCILLPDYKRNNKNK